MTPLDEIEGRLEQLLSGGSHGKETVAELLRLGEEVLEHWIVARGETPTQDRREGFRLLALHRQGAKGAPSFNACRETCRELVYRYNLIMAEPDPAKAAVTAAMAVLVAKHLYLFVSGKMEVEGLGEFCCSSRTLRQASR
jgi:hypothetical protein